MTEWLCYKELQYVEDAMQPSRTTEVWRHCTAV